MNNKGIRVFIGSSSSDIFFTKPETSLSSSSHKQRQHVTNLSLPNKKDNYSYKPFNKAKLINNISTFEIHPNQSCDFVEIKRTLNNNGLNMFNVKNHMISSSLSKHKIIFDTTHIDIKDTKYKNVKEELKRKGIDINMKNNKHSFIRHGSIIPSDMSYINICNYVKRVPKSLSQVNINNNVRHGRKYMLTKDGFSDTTFKNFFKDNNRVYDNSRINNKKQ